jgi:hypothetical protein
MKKIEAYIHARDVDGGRPLLCHKKWNGDNGVLSVNNRNVLCHDCWNIHYERGDDYEILH